MLLKYLLDFFIIIATIVTFSICKYKNYDSVTSITISCSIALLLSIITLIIIGMRTKKTPAQSFYFLGLMLLSFAIFAFSYYYNFKISRFDDFPFIDNSIAGVLVALGSGFMYKGLDQELKTNTYIRIAAKISAFVVGLFISIAPLYIYWDSKKSVFSDLAMKASELASCVSNFSEWAGDLAFWVSSLISVDTVEHTFSIFIGIGTAIVFSMITDFVSSVLGERKAESAS